MRPKQMERRIMKQDLVKFNLALKGKTIKRVVPMHPADADIIGWYKIPWVIEFTDGSALTPQMDDEANDGGAMLYVNNTGNDFLLYTYTERDHQQLKKELENERQTKRNP